MRSRPSSSSILSKLPVLEGEKTKSVFLICLVFFAMSLFVTTYLCPGTVCSKPHQLSFNDIRIEKLHRVSIENLEHNHKDRLRKTNGPSFVTMTFNQIVNDLFFVFDINASDVIVFLHIQKTGGTIFGRHLVRDLKLDAPCVCPTGKKRCICPRPSDAERYWLFSRYSMGWKCGLHADWTELTHCVNSVMDATEGSHRQRRYFYITLLRDPVARLLSEWRHVQRGATWKNSIHWCGGRSPTEEELPSCYDGLDWRNVTLRQFLSCPFNLGINRQTRMLADLNLVGCYNTTIMSKKQREAILLASAKENLRRTAFFGICENQTVSQYLFERTFGMSFKRPFIQLNKTRSSYTMEIIDPGDLEMIRRLNHLDIELYKYAQQLLKERFKKMKQADHDFEEHFSRISPLHWDLDETEERLTQRIEKQRLQIELEKKNRHFASNIYS